MSYPFYAKVGVKHQSINLFYFVTDKTVSWYLYEIRLLPFTKKIRVGLSKNL